MIKARDMRRKIAASFRGKSESEQAGIIEGLIQDWPTNVRGSTLRCGGIWCDAEARQWPTAPRPLSEPQAAARCLQYAPATH